jgi:monoamine oxidase
LVENGPQQLLLRMFDVAVGRGMRVWLDERVTSLERHGGGAGFVVGTDRLRQVLATKLVWATPPGAFRKHVKKGALAKQLADTAEMKSVAKGQSASVLNLYMKKPFWHNLQWAAEQWMNVSVERKFMSWTLEYGPVLQFIATPDRIKTNMLRLFYSHKQANVANELFRRSGIAGVVESAIKQLRKLPDLKTVDFQLNGAMFHHERFAYARLDAEAGITAEHIAEWAKQPVEQMCFASEGFAVRHAGWMGGAVDASTLCFRTGGALSSYMTEEELDAQWNKGCLTSESCRNECEKLSNENDMRDIATGGMFTKVCNEAKQTLKV